MAYQGANMSNDSQKGGFIASKMAGLVFDLMKHFVRDMENARTAKRVDKFAHKISSLEHLVVKMDAKIQENRRQLEDMRMRLVWSLVLNLVSAVGIIVLVAQLF
jgi:hypothetical protein